MRVRALFAVLLVGTAFLIAISSGTTPLVTAAFSKFNQMTLNPTRGSPGTTVYVSASGSFDPQVAFGATCVITSDIVGLVTSGSAGIVAPGTVAGSFIVGNVPAKGENIAPPNLPTKGSYNVTLVCYALTTTTSFFSTITSGSTTIGNFGSAFFQVIPRITITPSIGTAGQVISVTGNGFRSDATTCNIQNVNNTVSVVQSQTCSVSGGALSGVTQFTVNYAAPNAIYNVSIILDRMSNVSAYGYFRKVATPTIAVSPNFATPGYGALDGSISVSGAGFPASSSQRGCTLSASGGTVFFASSPSPTCILSTSGTVSGSFAIAPTAAANVSVPFMVNVTDAVTPFYSAGASFTVLPRPLIMFNVTSASIGQAVNVSVVHLPSSPFTPSNRFSQFDLGPCTMTSNPSGLFLLSSCNIRDAGLGGSGLLTAFFIVATSNPATYVVTVTPVHGDSASNSFSPAGGPTVAVSPNASPPSPPSGIPVFVSVSGTGFNSLDTSCRVGFKGNSTPIVEPSTTPTCAMVHGSVSGAFQVAKGALPGSYQVNVTGYLPGPLMNDVGFATFDIAVTGITTTTSTSWSPTATSLFSTTTVTSTTGVSSSFSTTTVQTTGRFTENYRTYTTTTIFGQTSATAMSTSVITTTSTISTSTILTTLSTTITHTLGQIIKTFSAPSFDILALLGAAVAVSPWIIRRLL